MTTNEKNKPLNPMKNKDKRSYKTLNINQVIEKSSFGNLMEKGLQLSTLNERLASIFPAPLRNFYRVADLQNGLLKIEVSNAMVRQNLLFQQAQLLAKIQQIEPAVTKLNFYLNPNMDNRTGKLKSQ